jgi:hypothetical protein
VAATVQQDIQTWIQAVDRRKFCRVRVSAKAKLYTAGEAREVDCVVDTLSPGGAGVRCKNPPPARAHVALYINGFGRFEGVTTRPTKDGIGVRFICTPRKRQKIVEQLTMFVKEGLAAGVSHLKYYNRAGLEIADRRAGVEITERSLAVAVTVSEEIEVTAEMLSAGEAELRAWDDPTLNAADVLMAIYIAMVRAQNKSNDAQKQLRRTVVKRRAGG